MLKLMITVDGSAAALHGVDYAIGLAKHQLPVQIHLFNVQEPPVYYGEMSIAIPPDDLEAIQLTAQKKVLDDAERVVTEAGLTCTRNGTFGNVAQEIVREAEDQKCEGIVMGTRGMGALGNLLLGSIANKVVHMTKVPVTLVK